MLAEKYSENHILNVSKKLILETNRIIREYDDLGGAGEGPNDGYASQGLFKIFAEPLKDIFSALKLTAMDISNAIQLVVKTALNFYDPEKLKEIKNEYEFKQSKLLKQWGPIVQRSIASIQNADPFITLAISPHLFMATKILTKSIEAGKTTAEILAGEDWNSIINKINRVPDEKTGFGAIIRQQQQTSKETNNLLRRLNALFSGKRFNESILREQVEQKKYTDANEFLNDFFRETGLDKEFNDTASVLLQNKLPLLKESTKQLLTALCISKLIKTKNIDEFVNTLNDLAQLKEIDKSSIQTVQKMMQDIKEKSKIMSSNDEFLENLSQKLKKKKDKISKQEALKAATDLIFLASKQDFDKSNKNQINKFSSDVEQIYKLLVIDNKTLTNLKNKKSEIRFADDYLTVYDKFILYYKEFKTL